MRPAPGGPAAQHPALQRTSAAAVHHGYSLQSAARFLNCFQYCTKAFRMLGNVMVLMVLALILFSYYTVVFAIYGPMMFDSNILQAVGSIVAVVVYTALNIMTIWCYLAAVTADPGTVPPGWHPFVDEQQARVELERMSYSNYYFDRRDPRRPRFCKRCQCWKPERAHHCGVLGRCVLKMDHYCIWVVNCVGLLNYKFFLLFLVYSLVASLMAVLLLLKPLIDFFSDKLHGSGAPVVFLTVVIDGTFVACLAGFLIMHGQLLAANCTTIEMYEKDRIHPWPYNKGWRRNLEEVFGRNKLRCFLPYYTKEEKRALLDTCLNTRLLSTGFALSAAV